MPLRLLHELAALVAPPACVACRAPPARVHDVLCPACRRDLPWLPADRCARCALPLPCPRPCPASGAPWAGAWSAVAYDGSARELVLALKFRGALAVAQHMAATIAAGAPAGLWTGAALVPVPLPAARRRQRGFDQAARLAAAIARRTGAPMDRCLARRGAASRQLGAGRAERQRAGRVGVIVRRSPPPRAVLVDDVHTTGATFRACAAALAAAGCRRIDVVSYARTL